MNDCALMKGHFARLQYDVDCLGFINHHLYPLSPPVQEIGIAVHIVVIQRALFV